MKAKWGVGSRMFAWALAGLLTLGSGTTLVADPSAALSVGSDPVGAAVYVDGQLAGQTPLSLARVAAGDHRVRVVKEGYLDNSRVVTVRAGQADSVNVRMTRSNSAVRMQVDDTGDRRGGEKGGGSGKKIAFIALGVAAVGAGVFLLLPKNDPPVAGTVTASPVTALMAATSVTFTSVGSSDPNGDPLTYTWDYGDGGQGSGATSTHVYQAAGTYAAKCTVSDGKKSAVTPPVSVTVKSISGGWSGSDFGASVNLTQSGTTIAGSYNDSYGPGAVSNGKVTAPNRLEFRVTQNLSGCIWTGDFSCSLNSDFNSCPGNVTERVQCGSSVGVSTSQFSWTRQ